MIKRTSIKYLLVTAIMFATFSFGLIQPVSAVAPKVSLDPSPINLTEGETQTVTVTLDEPIIAPTLEDGYVFVSVDSDSPSRLNLASTFVNYDYDEWNQPKSFDITSADDDLINGDTAVTLSYEVFSNAEYYDGFTGSITVNIIDNDNAPVVTYPAAGQTVNAGSLTITGTAVANQKLEVLVDGASIGTTTADNSGKWSKLVASVSAGSHTIVTKVLADHHFAFMANQYSESIDVVNVDTHTYVHEITDENSVGTTYDTQNSTVYSAARWNNSCALRAINPTTYQIIESLGFADGSSPVGVTLNSDGSTAYLLCDHGDNTYFVVVVATAINNPVDQFELDIDGLNPSGLTLTPDDSQLWIRTSETIEIYSGNGDTHIDSLLFADPDAAWRQNIVFNSDGTRAYTANATNGQVSVIDTSNNSVIANPVTGEGANMVALSPDGSKLFVSASYPSSAVYEINTSNNTVTDNYSVDPDLPPESLAITDDGQWIVGDDHGTGAIFFGTVAGGATVTNTIYAPNGGSYYTSTSNFVTPLITGVLGASTALAFNAVAYQAPNTGFGGQL